MGAVGALKKNRAPACVSLLSFSNQQGRGELLISALELVAH